MLRLVVVGICAVGLSLGAVACGSPGQASLRVHAARADSAEPSHRRWPLSMCTRQPGHRFTTTTVGGGDHGLSEGYLGEPAAAHVRPTISARRAMHNFRHVYGPITTTEARHTQIRFGLTSDLQEGPVSGNVIGFVPFVRRTRAWLVSNCVDAPSPKDYGAHFGGGTLIAIIADTRAPKALSYAFFPRHPTSANPGETTGELSQHPAPGSTPFYSTPWRVAERGKHGNILLRYQPRRCYTFDHINLDGAPPGPTSVSVILSSGPKGDCPKPSATSPYAEIKPSRFDGPFTKLLHERTGKARFEPESS
ncbi:hypothetical protein [Mycobacterium sp.]|uniref:hypothetical protein n=1 Tax=Mycobacterium sp. TaxID=1785 RepID=UPI003BAEBE11